MSQFTDSKGRVWTLEITVAGAKELKAGAGVDVYRLLDNRMKELGALLGDVERLVDTAWVLIREQAEPLGVDEIAFARSINGEVLEAIGDAVGAAIADFFQPSKAAILKVMAKGRELSLALSTDVVQKIDSVTTEQIVKTLNSGTAATLSNLSGDSQEKPESAILPP